MESSGPAIERKSIVSFSTFINRDSIYTHGWERKGEQGSRSKRKSVQYPQNRGWNKATAHPPLFDQEVGAQVNDNEPPGGVLSLHRASCTHTYYAGRCACISIYLDATAKLFVILIQASATLAPLQRADCSTVLFPNVCVSLFFLGTVYSSPPPFTPLGRGTRV